MTYDYYDYFIKQRNNQIFTEVSNIVRQKIWGESFENIESQKWLKIEEKIRIDMYLYLRYN